jgi:hypothetical protein
MMWSFLTCWLRTPPITYWTDISKRATALCPSIASLPRCEAEREHDYANDTINTDRQCKKYAKYCIEGKYYCTGHASMWALRTMLDEDRVT